MIYVCIPSHNEADTVGILLWKVRKVFADFPREYHILLLDDGSTDRSAEVVEPYKKVLPLTVIRRDTTEGYAAAVEALLQAAVERTDRPKRDSALLLQADFTYDAEKIPDFVRRLESGADLVIGQATVLGAPRWNRWLRGFAHRLFRKSAKVEVCSDLASGFLACRLITVRNAFRNASGTFFNTSGWAANAELQARLAQAARSVATLDVEEHHDMRQRPSRVRPVAQARALWRQRKRIVLPEPKTEPEPERRPRSRPRTRRKRKPRAA
jgi:glycosyltransferase involved in cell wall biosynthesis